MKKFLLVFLVFTFIPCFSVFCQGLVYDAVLDSIMTTSHVDQMIHYAQMVSALTK